MANNRQQDFWSDPAFLGLPAEEKRKVLLRLDSAFAGLPRDEQDKVLGLAAAPPSLLGEFGAGGLEATVGAPTAVEAAQQFGGGLPYLLRHPLESAKMMGSAAVKAHGAAREAGLERMRGPGLASKAVGALQYTASGVPLLGPALVLTGEELARGDISYARAAGRTVGTLATLGAGRAGLTTRGIPKPPKLAGFTRTKVAGVVVPRIAGEATGAVLTTKVAGLLKGSLVGERLVRLAKFQQKRINLALNHIAERITKAEGRGKVYEMPADAFKGGAKALKDRAKPIYENIRAITSELAPSAPERIGAMTGQVKARYMRYQGKVKAVAQRMTELLSDLDISEMLGQDPDVANTLRTRLATLQTAERLTVPFETFKSTRSALIKLRSRAFKAGKDNAARLLSEAVDAVNDSAGELLKAIDDQRGTTLAKDWRTANNWWRRASLSEDLAEMVDSVTEGTRPSTQAAIGDIPVPPTIGGKTFVTKLRAMKGEIEKVYGERAYTQLETLGDILVRGQKTGGIVGHFMTLQAMMMAMSIPAVGYAGYVTGGIGGAVAGAFLGPGLLLGGEMAIGKVAAIAMTTSGGRAALIHLFRTKAGTAAAAYAATRVLDIANQNTERVPEGGLPTPPAPQAIEVGPADLRQDTEIMLQAKEGEITPAEANQQIPRRRRAIRLLRPPPQE